jgi:hypothetical protein
MTPTGKTTRDLFIRCLVILPRYGGRLVHAVRWAWHIAITSMKTAGREKRNPPELVSAAQAETFDQISVTLFLDTFDIVKKAATR